MSTAVETVVTQVKVPHEVMVTRVVASLSRVTVEVTSVETAEATAAIAATGATVENFIVESM